MTAEQVDEVNVFDRLNALERDQERAYYELGSVWGTPPRLHQARHNPGRATHAALGALLDHIEARSLHGKQLRTILAGCHVGTKRVFNPSTSLFGLPKDLLEQVLLVFAWIAGTGGITLDDFEDRGERYLSLVLRKRPKTIARLIGGEPNA